MTLQDNQKAFSLALANLVNWGSGEGYTFRQGDGWRSTDPLKCPGCDKLHSYQDLLIYNGRSKEKNSKHCDRLAHDYIVERKDGSPMTQQDWLVVGQHWESLGARWGGRFGVRPEHYQTKLGWDAGHFEWIVT